MLMSLSVAVRMDIPGAMGVWHAACNRCPSISTMHMRQPPSGSSPSALHSVGMSMPRRWAAIRIVSPGRGSIVRPSMVVGLFMTGPPCGCGRRTS